MSVQLNQNDMDSLDAFMATLEQDVPPTKNTRDNDDEQCDVDDPLDMFVFNTTKRTFSDRRDHNNNTDDQEDHDEHRGKKFVVDKLAPVDHSSVAYESFERDFFVPPSGVSSDVSDSRRSELGVSVKGVNVPPLCATFEEIFKNHNVMLEVIRKRGFVTPTPIQCQAVPVILSGRDMIGIAETGSGKTAAFVWPMLVHVSKQPKLNRRQGPRGVIVAPTRELASQIFVETRRFAKNFRFRVVAVYGGLNKHEQFRALKKGCEIVVATPGRLLDLLKMKACTFFHVTYVVLDEADRMLQLGFESQVRSILGQTRPDRQTVLFSATFPKRVERVTHSFLSTNYVRVSVGRIGASNKLVQQMVHVVNSAPEKLTWITNQMPLLVKNGQVLVFVSTRNDVETLARHITTVLQIDALAIHGNKTQYERMDAIQAFKMGKISVLVATDVAARGLDIKDLPVVVNFDMAQNMDTYVHRIGRTGRQGNIGFAYTLITRKQHQFAGFLVDNLEEAGQQVPPELVRIALQHAPWREKRSAKRVNNHETQKSSRTSVPTLARSFVMSSPTVVPTLAETFVKSSQSSSSSTTSSPRRKKSRWDT